MDDENINDNVHDNRINVDNEEIIDKIRSLPSITQDQSSLKSGLRLRHKIPNCHRDSSSKKSGLGFSVIKNDGLKVFDMPLFDGN